MAADSKIMFDAQMKKGKFIEFSNIAQIRSYQIQEYRRRLLRTY